MTTNYDQLGAHYLLTKALPWKRFSEAYTFLKAVGPVRGLRVIDVACGEGFYSRQFRDAGAEVVGVDVSTEMIRLATEREARERKGIRYEVGDARELEHLAARSGLGIFDLAVAQWLLDYADTRDSLRAMCRSLARVVRPGGRFVHVGGCFESLFGHPERFVQYGVELAVIESCGDGSRCRWTVAGGGESVSAENTMWTPATITVELETTGFTDIEWPGAEVSPAGVAEMGAGYWTAYLEHPYHAVTCATRRRLRGPSTARDE
jgi:SAM-dependent methyltransferase